MKNIFRNIGQQNTKGFTFVELMVVIAIITIMSIGSFTLYNQFTHGIDLERSQTQLLTTIDQRRLEILNGNQKCAEIRIKEGDVYFTTLTHRYDECKTKKSFIEGFNVNDQLEAVIEFTPHQQDLALKVINSRGNVEHFDIAPADDQITIPVNLTKHYSFVVYDPLERQNTESTLDLYFLSEDNLDLERITRVRVAKIEAITPDLQTIETDTIKMTIALPLAQIAVFSDSNRMQSAKVTLEKEHSVVDPVSTTLSSVTSEPTTLKNFKSFTIGEF